MASQLLFLTVAVVVLAQVSMAYRAQNSVDVKQAASTVGAVDYSTEAVKAETGNNSLTEAAGVQRKNSIKITVRHESVEIDINTLESGIAIEDNQSHGNNVAASDAGGSGINAAHVAQSVNSTNSQNWNEND